MTSSLSSALTPSKSSSRQPGSKGYLPLPRHNLFQRLFAHGQLLDEIMPQFIPAARLVGDGDDALRRHDYFGFDDVIFPIALRGRDVAWQLEIQKCRECHIVGAANSGFEHAAAPHGYGEALGDVVHCDGVGEAANAPYFDVDDATGAKLERGFRVARAADGFVEAYRGFYRFLQAGVEVEVVVPEGLLDHE